MDDFNYKTIFVLDHTQYFSISSEDYLPLDFHSSPNAGSLMQFSKSLWTCSVESSIEYCRIVWDLFPREKLVRLIVSDNAAHIVNTWLSGTQNMAHVLNAMSLVGVPQRNTVPQSSEYSVIHGLRAGIEGLSEATETQNAQIRELKRAGRNKNELSNKGRVICITSARDNTSMKSLEDIFYQVLLKQNQMAMADDNFLPIEHCHLVIINVVPLNVESLVSNHARLELSNILTTEVHSTRAPEIAKKLTHLIMSHYNLASTTVTGIPMKEEQNANSSANYDVEIVHARNAHTVICGNESLLPISIKEGVEYETVTLKWCTPRGCGASDMQACLAQHRVTPVDVTSRPSACLINFLLSGRSVLLEMPRRSAGKTTSHLLSARGGEIFIHALQITRSPVDDPPAISEGPGSRVSDYRNLDFVNFMKMHRLVPLKSKLTTDDGLQRLRDRLHRRAQYFPLTSNSSVVYNLQRSLAWLPSFLRLIAKENMDKMDEGLCQQYIFDLYTAATRKDPLVFTNMSMSRLRGSKKVEQYRLLCLELEHIIRGHATTPHHKILLESVQNVRQACCEGVVKAENDGSRDSTGRNIIRCTTDSPLSPPHSVESSSSSSLTKCSKKSSSTQHTFGLSLDAIFAIAERKQCTKRMEFVGRITTPPGHTAALYPNLGAKEKEAATASSNSNKDDIVVVK